MFPRDAISPQLIGGAGDGGAGARRRSRLRVPAMLFPYVGILAGAVILARIPESDFQRFWWFAPATAIAYLVGLSLTIGSLARRRRLVQHARDTEAALEARLIRSLQLPDAGRRDAIESLIPSLRDVRIASGRLSDEELALLRETLVELDASTTVSAEASRRRRKWRRADALFTLGWLADERAIPTLCDALNGRDPDLAYVAGQSLAEYDSARACGCLLDALRTEAIPRPLAATLLEGSRYARAPALIAQAREARDPEVRSWVAYLVGRTRDLRAQAWLSSLAGDPEAKVRASAAEALAGFADAATLGCLLADDDWLVRANAARSVGRAGLSELADQLAPLLHDRVWWVRQSATLALKQLGARSVTAVRPLLEHEDRFARNKAAEVLVEVGYVAEQIAALAGSGADVAAARRSLAALVRAEARPSIEAGAAGVVDALTRERVLELLEEVDDDQ
jgi:HEAT repeat protein